MNKNGFASLTIVLVIVILGMVGFLGYKYYFQYNNSRALSISTSKSDNDVIVKNLDGNYVHCSIDNSCNYINIKFLSNKKATIKTEAYWVGPGDKDLYKISGDVIIENNRSFWNNDECNLDILFEKEKIVLLQRSWKDCGGPNQSFDGIYIKK